VAVVMPCAHTDGARVSHAGGAARPGISRPAYRGHLIAGLQSSG